MAKASIATGGANLVRGAALVSALSQRPRVPSLADTNSSEAGITVAATPGTVVFRTPVFQLVQYTAQTDEVRETPLLIVTPTISTFYILGLAHGRSIVKHLVLQGQQVFMLSWRNPTARARGMEPRHLCVRGPSVLSG